jgi:hypothetical protein
LLKHGQLEALDDAIGSLIGDQVHLPGGEGR